ncbi:MAG TPA: hypothetical protein VG095_06190, partial [Chthoniobacterales bacterium]|nr:hypothetical protein [Chthoniobacterales bacterium]
MEFYVYLNGGRRGPFSEERVRGWLADGLLRPLDLASDGPNGNLQPLVEFAQLAGEQTPAPTAPTLTPPPVPPGTGHGAVVFPDYPRLPPGMLGPYARATLAPNETPFYRTSLHWIVFVRFALGALFAFLFLAMPFAIAVQALTSSQLGWFALPLPAFIMLTPTLAYLSSELVITNIRVLIKTG